MTSSSVDTTQDPSSTRVADLGQALFRVARALIFRPLPEAPLSDLPISQMRCLRVIGCEPGQKMQDLAEKLEVKLPALSQSVDKLVRRGLVERHADPHDRRVIRLHLTQPAQAILSQAHALREARTLATLHHLDEDAFEQVMTGLRLLAAAAEQVDADERRTVPPNLRPDADPSPDADPLVEMMAHRARLRRERMAAADPKPEETLMNPLSEGTPTP